MLDGQIFDENKPSLDVFLKKNCRFTKKMQKWREKVDITFWNRGDSDKNEKSWENCIYKHMHKKKLIRQKYHVQLRGLFKPLSYTIQIRFLTPRF